jgi:hypothetical protein
VVNATQITRKKVVNATQITRNQEKAKARVATLQTITKQNERTYRASQNGNYRWDFFIAWNGRRNGKATALQLHLEECAPVTFNAWPTTSQRQTTRPWFETDGAIQTAKAN